MKLAVYYPWLYTRGGGERVVLEHAKRSKHEITIFTNFFDHNKTYPEFKNLSIKTIGNIRLKSATYSSVFSACLNQLFTKIPVKKFDALLIHCVGISDITAIRNSKIPLAAFCHTILRGAHDFHQTYIKNYNPSQQYFVNTSINIYKLFEKLAWQKFKLIMCNSINTRNRILHAKLASESKLKVIHPGIDLSKFSPGKSKNYFLSLGRFTFYKRIDLIAKAFIEFKNKNPKSRFELIIAGNYSPKDQPYFNSIKNLIENRKDIKLILDPDEKAVLDLYKHCYAFLFAAMNEDWGLAPLEAMACSKPVISVREGGQIEQIKDNFNGLFAEPTPESFAEKMEFLVKDKKLATKLGRNARNFAKQFSWDKFVKQLDREVENLKRN